MRNILLIICLALSIKSNFIQSAPLPQSQSELQPFATPEEKSEESSSNGKLIDLTVAIVPSDEIEESVDETIGNVDAGLRKNGVADEEERLGSEGQLEKRKRAIEDEKEEQIDEEELKEEPQTQEDKDVQEEIKKESQINEDEEAQDEKKEELQIIEDEEAQEEVKEETATKHSGEDEEVKGEEDNEHKEKLREEEDGLDKIKLQLPQGELTKIEEVDDKTLKNAENFEASQAIEENKIHETKNEANISGGFLEILPNDEEKSEEEREIKLVKRSKRSGHLTNPFDLALTELEEEGQSSEGLDIIDEELQSAPIDEEEDKNWESDQLENLPSDTSENRLEHEEENEDIQADNSKE